MTKKLNSFVIFQGGGGSGPNAQPLDPPIPFCLKCDVQTVIKWRTAGEPLVAQRCMPLYIWRSVLNVSKLVSGVREK